MIAPTAADLDTLPPRPRSREGKQIRIAALDHRIAELGAEIETLRRQQDEHQREIDEDIAAARARGLEVEG